MPVLNVQDAIDILFASLVLAWQKQSQTECVFGETNKELRKYKYGVVRSHHHNMTHATYTCMFNACVGSRLLEHEPSQRSQNAVMRRCHPPFFYSTTPYSQPWVDRLVELRLFARSICFLFSLFVPCFLPFSCYKRSKCVSSTRNYLFSSAWIEYEKDGVSLLVIILHCQSQVCMAWTGLVNQLLFLSYSREKWRWRLLPSSVDKSMLYY